MLGGDDGRHRFLSGGAGDDRPPGTRPVRGRFERWTRNGQATLLRSGRQLGPTARRVRDWLERQVEPDEPLLFGLRRADRLVVEYPNGLEAEEVVAAWRSYLRRRRYRHLVRFGLNLLASPLTLLLAPIPGPNVIGYWFVYRAGAHALILVGLQRALSGSLPTEFVPLPTPVRQITAEDWDRLAYAARKHGGPAFSVRLAEIFGLPTGAEPLAGSLTVGAMVEVAPEPAAEPDVKPAPEPASAGASALSLLPNSLTILRLGLAIAFPWMPPRWWLGVAGVAAATEFLDGWLSRRLGATSHFGRVLDPIADKAFVGMVLITLWRDAILDTWMLPALAARDLIVLLGGAWVLLREGGDSLRRMAPSLLGKVATAVQFGFLLLCLWQRDAPRLPLVATATLSLAAGLDYLRRPRPAKGDLHAADDV